MQGNLHVPFLGGWAGAIPPGYPARVGNHRLYPEGVIRSNDVQHDDLYSAGAG